MKTNILLGIIILTILSGCQISNEKGSSDVPQTEFDTIKFTFHSFDSLALQAQLITTPGSKQTILFLNGSTPYDEKGNIGSLLPGNIMIKSRHDFYMRFIEVMTRKGYDVATFSKRSFTYPELRPSLDELAQDADYLIKALENRHLIKDLYIVGYSEGSYVATKLLPQISASGCILLGSGSQQFDYVQSNWDEWPTGIAYKRIRGWTDDQIKLEYEQWSDIMRSLVTMDEEHFEKVYKHSKPHGFGFAPWESFRIDRDVQFYNPTDNIKQSNIPVLIVIGENDMAMPGEYARRTFEELQAVEHDVTYHMISGETHQYAEYEVFPAIHSWIQGEFSIDYDEIDIKIIEHYAEITSITNAINKLSWDAIDPELDSLFIEAINAEYNIGNKWFKLALVLFSNDFLDESSIAFEKAGDLGYVAYYATSVWLGHIQDLLGHREAALKYYQEALNQYPGFPVQHDHIGLVLTEEYIKGRLEEPFEGVK